MIGLTAHTEAMFRKTQSKKAGGNNSGFWKENLVAEDKGFYSAFPR